MCQGKVSCIIKFMSENKDPWQGVGYGVETRSQQTATIFDGLLYSAIKHGLGDEKVSGFLAETEPSTKLTNRVLLAKTAVDLQSPNGRVIVQIIADKTADFLVSAEVASFSSNTPDNVAASSKPMALILLNESSPRLELVYRRKSLFSKKTLADIKLSADTALQVLQQIAINQARLETEPSVSMTRIEYFALLDQAKSNG